MVAVSNRPIGDTPCKFAPPALTGVYQTVSPLVRGQSEERVDELRLPRTYVLTPSTFYRWRILAAYLLITTRRVSAWCLMGSDTVSHRCCFPLVLRVWGSPAPPLLYSLISARTVPLYPDLTNLYDGTDHGLSREICRRC